MLKIWYDENTPCKSIVEIPMTILDFRLPKANMLVRRNGQKKKKEWLVSGVADS